MSRKTRGEKHALPTAPPDDWPRDWIELSKGEFEGWHRGVLERTEEEVRSVQPTAGGIVLPAVTDRVRTSFAGLSVWRSKGVARFDDHQVMVVMLGRDGEPVGQALLAPTAQVIKTRHQGQEDARVRFLRRRAFTQPFPGGLVALVRTLEGTPRTQPSKPSARVEERARKGVLNALRKLGLEEGASSTGRIFSAEDVLSVAWRDLREFALAFWMPLSDEIVVGSDEGRKGLASHASLLLRSLLRYGLVARLEELGIAEEIVSDEGAVVAVTYLLAETEPEVYRRAAGAFGAVALELSEQGGETQREARALGTLLQQISVGAPGGFKEPEGDPSTAHRSEEVKALIAALQRMGLTSARVSARVEFHLEDLSDVRRRRRSRAAAAFRDEVQRRTRTGEGLVRLLEILAAGSDLPTVELRDEASEQGPDLFEHVAKLLKELDITSASDEAGRTHTLSDLTSADEDDRKAAVSAFCRLVDRGLSDRGQERITWHDQEARRKADDAEAPFRDVLSLLQGISLGARNLTEVDELWHGSGGATNEEEGAVADEPGIETDVAPREAFAEASVGELVQALVPEVPQAAIDRLEELIREAQKSPPDDREGFAAQVNRILDAQNLRIQLDDGSLARLTVTPTSSLGSIQFTGPGIGTRGFRNAAIEVVRAPAGYLQNRRRPRERAPRSKP